MKHETSAPGSSAPLQGRRPLHSDILLKDQALVESKPNCQPGMNLEEREYREKVLLTSDKEKRKGKFCGRWELKTGWEGTGGRAEHRGRTKQPSSAHSSQRISRLGVVQAAPHWCLQDSGLCPPAAKVSTWGLDMILQHFGGPVPSTFQLLQGKLHTTVLLMVIIPVFSLFMSLAFS